jgi:acyl-CoA thioester hydrolase
MCDLPTYRFFVEPTWIDNYGHMTAARYAEVFDKASQQLMENYGLGAAYTRDERFGLYTLELNIKFHKELLEGDPIQIYMRIDSVDSKRLFTSYRMFHSRDRYVAASCDQLAIHVDLQKRKASPFAEPVHSMLRELASEHKESCADGTFIGSLFSVGRGQHGRNEAG